MEWIHQELVEETIGWFVSRAVPDAQADWRDAPWMIEDFGVEKEIGRWFTIAFDIHTSVESMDCALTFRVVEPAGEVREAYVDDVSAIRSGRGDHEGDLYVWNDREDMWVTAPNDDDDRMGWL